MTVVNTAPPTLSGTFRQGRTVSTSNGTWTKDLDYLTYAYQWLRCDAAGGNCTPIQGQTQSQYLIQAADVGFTLRSEVTATEHDYPNPPSGDPYTSIDFAAGLYHGEGLGSVFEAYQVDARLSDWGGLPGDYYDNPGAFGYSPGTSMTTDTNQRVYLFDPTSRGLPANPTGSGFASWHELRSTDGYWQQAASNLAKASVSTDNADVTWGPGGFSVGAVRWFAWDMLFPLNIGGVSFQFVNNWHTTFDLHTSEDFGGDPCLGDIATSGGGHSGHPRYLCFTQTPAQSVPYVVVPLLQLSNSDGSRFSASYNVWHEVVVGMKASRDSSGWYEIWFDGSQVVGQTSRAMISQAETGPYVQMQNYTSYPTNFVGGATKSVIVYGGFRAGLTRADVQTM